MEVYYKLYKTRLNLLLIMNAFKIVKASEAALI